MFISMKITRLRRPLLLSLALFSCLSVANAEIKLPAIFADHMVLQRETDVALWGWADAGESVAVTLSWSDAPIQTESDAQGAWKVTFSTGEAGSGPHSLTVAGSVSDAPVTVSDVLFGEVWLCSGQSNMEMSIDNCSPLYVEAKAEANHPRMRIFNVTRQISGSPLQDCEGSWAACTPETVGGFSAVAYFYGKKLMTELDVPIGLIGTNWGGTVCEAWTSAESLESMPYFEDTLKAARSGHSYVVGSEIGGDLHANCPTALFNGMIAPLVPFGIRGAIWYQGESNLSRAKQYVELFPLMIADWRKQFGRGDFPFYFTQIAPFNYDDTNHDAAYLREAQRLTLRTPNTGMAVTMDIGNPEDIHPKNKLQVGERLALWALAKTYERPIKTWSGPLFRLVETERGELRLHFDQAGGGLMANGPIEHFEILDQQGVWHEAEARIDGTTVLVLAPGITMPQAARYGWGSSDELNLKNDAGLPASSFTTEDWPSPTLNR